MTLDLLAQQLEATGDYRVLRRVPEPVVHAGPPAEGKRVAILIDVETTGTDPTVDEVIEIGLVAFEYDEAGLGRVLRTFTGLQQPKAPLSEEIHRITGLSDPDLAGQHIDDADVEAFLDGAVFVIAHKAEFDRPFVERRWPKFARLGWGCSLTQVPWREEGFEGSSLKALLTHAGMFHAGHRALHDALATLHLLGRPLPISGRNPLAVILDRSRVSSTRVWACGAPFDCKDALKARGYRWSDGSGGLPKAWNIEVSEADLDAEKSFLAERVYRGRPDIRTAPVTARGRFSARAGLLATDRMIEDRAGGGV